MGENIPINETKKRHVILDFLRGIALFGICLANFPEFSLYTFLPAGIVSAMPTADIDNVVRFLQYFLIDGKFYTLFSLLFGIGFTIIIAGYTQKGKGLSFFYRRMIILLFIGLFHLYFLWAGDILILYAAMGLLLHLFLDMPDRKLLVWAVVLWLSPILMDALIGIFNLNTASPAERATDYFHNMVGINENNFPVWLVEKQSYWDIIRFNLGGSFIRIQEFIDGNRAFKIMGLFLLGLYIGRHKIYARLEEKKLLLRKVCIYGFGTGVPASLLYAWNAVSGNPLGMVGSAVVYALSVLPMSLGYITAFCLIYIRHKEGKVFKIFAAPGRMALTNYLMQSVFGIIIFYGVGFGLGAKIGLVHVELIAIGVYFIQVLYSNIWMHYFQYGPFEWVWRMLTYGRVLKLKKINEVE